MNETPILDSLEYNKRFEKSLGKEVSNAGQKIIQNFLSGHGLYLLPQNWDWTVDSPGYPSLVRRISSYMHDVLRLSLSSDLLNKLGNLITQHSTKEAIAYYDFDRELNWRDGDFGDPGSCFWHGRSEAREMLRKYRSAAIRTWSNRGASNFVGKGRAWVVEIPSLPTGCLLTFNAYQESLSYLARLIAEHINLEFYEPKHIINFGRVDGILYLNGGSGYLIGPRKKIEKVISIDFEWKSEQRFCVECGRRSLGRNLIKMGEDYYCKKCWDDFFFTCASCLHHFDWDKEESVPGVGRELLHVCRECYKKAKECEGCGQYNLPGFLYTMAFYPKNLTLCFRCRGKARICNYCETRSFDKDVCPKCKTHKNTSIKSITARLARERAENESSARRLPAKA